MSAAFGAENLGTVLPENYWNFSVGGCPERNYSVEALNNYSIGKLSCEVVQWEYESNFLSYLMAWAH